MCVNRIGKVEIEIDEDGGIDSTSLSLYLFLLCVGGESNFRVRGRQFHYTVTLYNPPHNVCERRRRRRRREWMPFMIHT